MAESVITAPPPSDGNVEYQLAFENLHVKRGKKMVISDVSGTADPGKMLALMGPSGAGKSTLLNVLAGRSPPLVSGRVLLNGRPLTKQLKRKISYVLQEDIFFSRLTMRETLTYAALLKLPEKMRMKQKMARVHEVAEALEITRCFDTIIGDHTQKGLSGGEKKRTSIACELLCNPAVLMLDEPTSGLDSNAAYALMETLKNYARTSRKTIVASIHQPSNQVFFMFDNILLLCDGQTAFFGDCKDILGFFASVGLHCEHNYNPADFILEKVKESEAVKGSILLAAKKERPSNSWSLSETKIKSNQASEVSLPAPSLSNDSLYQLDKVNNFRQSFASDSSSDERISGISLQSLVTSDGSVMKSVGRSNGGDSYHHEEHEKWPTSFSTQFNVLLRRNFKYSLPKFLSPVNFVQVLVISIFCGLIWFQLDKSESRIQERLGVCFFCTTFWAFGPAIEAVLAFPLERKMLNKERAAGYYRLSAFYLAKVVSGLPLILLQPTIFIAVVYWMTGLQGYLPFIKMWAHVILEAFTSQSIGFFLGALITDVDIGLKSVIVFMLCSLISGGFYVRTAPSWSYWLKYVSYMYYIYSGFLTFQFTGLELSCLPPNRTSYCTALYEFGVSNGTYYTSDATLEPTFGDTTSMSSLNTSLPLSFSGDRVLQTLGLTWPEWLYPLALGGFALVFQTMAYTVLRFVHRP